MRFRVIHRWNILDDFMVIAPTVEFWLTPDNMYPWVRSFRGMDFDVEFSIVNDTMIIKSVSHVTTENYRKQNVLILSTRPERLDYSYQIHNVAKWRERFGLVHGEWLKIGKGQYLELIKGEAS